MALPKPKPGMVISYSYLWRYEYQKRQEEGRKARPCVIILAVEKQKEGILVTVSPITHRKPKDKNIGVIIPTNIKQHLGLDHEDSWIVVNEVNQFIWPGYDLNPIPENKGSIVYGFLPPKLFKRIKAAILDIIIKRRVDITIRN